MAVQLSYDSSTRSDYLELKAPYYNAIETSEVTFENENIIAYADSLGHIEFFDMQKHSLGHVDLPVSKDPSERGHTAQYGDMKCAVCENAIDFQLPVYGWDDSYPHCDGESDRWSRYVARWFSVKFDLTTKEIEVSE